MSKRRVIIIGGGFGGKQDYDEILAAAQVQLASANVQVIRGNDFDTLEDRVSQKLAARLRRVRDSLNRPETSPSPSIRGPKGFSDV